MQRGLPVIATIVLALLTSPATAQPGSRLTADAEDVECLPIEDNGVAWAQINNNVADTTVRLNFRRMHDHVEDLYWVQMRPTGQGRYWGVFPKAEDRKLDPHYLGEQREEAQEEYRWAQWWREKQSTDHRDPNDDLDSDLIRERASLGKKLPREWLAEMDDKTFQDWLEQLENEPAEYYVSVHDAEGAELARSATKVTEVRENCRPDLSPLERGEAENLTVGESAHWQRGEEVFHWLCDGIVSRINPNRIKRGDEVCRACVIAWYKKKAALIPVTAAPVGILIGGLEDAPASDMVP